jgi:alpha,alpha-trehalose phosphorylase
MISHEAYPVDPWCVREQTLHLDLLAQSESLFALANGHLGLRGNLDEGEPRGLSGTYLNGFYESYPLDYGERGYGFAEDGQAVVNVTDGKIMRLLVEDEPLDVHRGRLQEHERVLDFRTGVLDRRLRWTSQAGRSVRVRTRRLVSFEQRSLAAIAYEVEAVDSPMRVALQSNLIANQSQATGDGDPRAAAELGPVLVPRLATEHGERVVLGHATRRTGLQLAAGMDHVIESADHATSLTQCDHDLGRVTITARLEPGRPLRVIKFLAYHWSSQQSIEWLRDQVDASLEIALAEGFDAAVEAQRRYLDAYWDVADVALEGDDEVQQGLRFALFEVLQASARAETRAIAAKGLTGTGYDGHAFWDTEAFVLPPLIYSKPELVRDALQWRHSILDLARERAAQLGLRGAAMPWRTIAGEECSGYWPAGMAAFHVNAAVADSVRRYVFASGDAAFEREMGLELLAESARLWESLGHHHDDGSFRIDGVTGPDEYSALIDNNVYTNLMAQANLRAAADAAERHPDAAERLGVDAGEIAAWRAAADATYLPFDERLAVHPQDQDFTTHERWHFEGMTEADYPLLLHHTYFDLYRKQVVKQADLVMALFARGDAFTLEEKRRDFDYYEGLTVRDSSLSACIQAIVAAEVGHLELAHDYLAEAAAMDLRDLESNVRDGLHIASLGGALLAVVCGLGGVRDRGDVLSFSPRLPDGIRRLCFPVMFRGRRLLVEVEPEAATYTLGDRDEGIEILHWGERLALGAGAPERRAVPEAPDLEPPRQPPGREPARAKARANARAGAAGGPAEPDGDARRPVGA